ncbi:MAG: hypothetical protein K9W44_06835 [Candidatus Lokiarchaeota archaeon]|nr:hypothetical protein [Candidatus Harpocratesius repetitus]
MYNKPNVPDWPSRPKKPEWPEYKPVKVNPNKSSDRMSFRPSRGCGFPPPPYDDLSDEQAGFLQYLRLVWEDPENAYDPDDLPFLKVSGPFDSKTKRIRYLSTLEFVGLHREPSVELDDLLAQIPDIFPELEHIFYEDQFSTEIPEFICQLPNLKTATLIIYNLSEIPLEFFTQHPKLMTISLYAPKITEIPDIFGLLRNFRFLTLYNSKSLKKLPDSLFEAPNLKTIEIYPPTGIFLSLWQWKRVEEKEIKFFYGRSSNVWSELRFWCIIKAEFRKDPSDEKIRAPLMSVSDLFHGVSHSTYLTYYEIWWEYMFDPFRLVPDREVIKRMAVERDLKANRRIDEEFFKYLERDRNSTMIRYLEKLKE